MLRSWSSLACASACEPVRPMFFHRLMVHCHWRAVAASVVPPAASFRMLVTSSLSRMLNWGLRPRSLPSSRINRTPSEWKVQISTSLAWRPMRPLARSRISAAALLVKVMAAIALGAMPPSIRCAILCVMTRVLPEPAPASTRHGPPVKCTARSWARLRPEDMGEVGVRRSACKRRHGAGEPWMIAMRGKSSSQPRQYRPC